MLSFGRASFFCGGYKGAGREVFFSRGRKKQKMSRIFFGGGEHSQQPTNCHKPDCQTHPKPALPFEICPYQAPHYPRSTNRPHPPDLNPQTNRPHHRAHRQAIGNIPPENTPHPPTPPRNPQCNPISATRRLSTTKPKIARNIHISRIPTSKNRVCNPTQSLSQRNPLSNTSTLITHWYRKSGCSLNFFWYTKDNFYLCFAN